MSCRAAHAAVATSVALLVCAVDANAQTVSVDSAGGTAARHHVIRAEVGVDIVNRTFELNGPSEVLFDAPFYPGLHIDLAFFPVALAVPESPAAGLGLRFETSKHVLNTVAAYDVDGEIYDFDVPTRHDLTHIELLYEWQVADSVTLTPAIAWHTLEFALGYNPLYRNSFYRGVEVSARLDYALAVTGLSLGGGIGVRPGVDLGSTVEPYGSTASSFGIAVTGGLRYLSRLGLFGDASISYDRYSTTYRPDRNTGRDDSKATDAFTGFVFALGYAY